jgi:lipopolysaccharide/colanic/teichoic acid biosynthesis glycosyltransferase
MCKRIIDLVFSLLGLLIAAPLMLLIALFIRLDSPGSVIFSQKRLGLKGRHFMVHKFRKFPSDWGNAGPGVTVAGDARMTKVGKFLERTKLDELPQLWNILLGEMSFVGPRPESLRYADLFTGEFVKVLDYIPGIFGPNQVAFRNEAELYPHDQAPEEFYRSVLFPQKAKQDIEYFSKANCVGDLVWIFRGVWVSLIGVVNWQRLLGLHLVILTVDILAIEIAWLLANVLRFGVEIDEPHFSALMTGMWLFPLILIPIMILAGNYRHPVRYFSMVDVIRLVNVVSFAWILASLVLLGFFQRNTSVSLVPLSLLLVLFMMVTPRKWHRERWQQQVHSVEKGNKIRIVLYGVGRRGMALASLLEHGFPKAELIGFIDDDEAMRGRFISKYKVMGCERDLDTLHTIHQFEQIWVTFMPQNEKSHRLEVWCAKHNVTLIVLSALKPFAQFNYRD